MEIKQVAAASDKHRRRAIGRADSVQRGVEGVGGGGDSFEDRSCAREG